MLNWDLFANFTEEEMACRHCGEFGVTAGLMEALQDLRNLTGPLVVSSGYRCKDHPVEIVKKAPGTGSHCRGLAVDIVCKNSSKRHQILKAAIQVHPSGPGSSRGNAACTMDVLKAGDHVTKNGQKGTVTEVSADAAMNELVRVLWNEYVHQGVTTMEYSRELKKREAKKS